MNPDITYFLLQNLTTTNELNGRRHGVIRSVQPLNDHTKQTSTHSYTTKEIRSTQATLHPLANCHHPLFLATSLAIIAPQAVQVQQLNKTGKLSCTPSTQLSTGNDYKTTNNPLHCLVVASWTAY